MTKTKRQFDLVDLVGNILAVALVLLLVYMMYALAFFFTDEALRRRQKKIDGCCAQCKDLSKKKGVSNEKK